MDVLEALILISLGGSIGAALSISIDITVEWLFSFRRRRRQEKFNATMNILLEICSALEKKETHLKTGESIEEIFEKMKDRLVIECVDNWKLRKH